MPISTLFGVVRAELEEVERGLAATAQVSDPGLSSFLSLVLPGGGKRVRPALALLAGRIGQPAPDRLLHMAIGVELLHTASLIHDDVVDDTPRRRGEAALFTQVGNAVAVLVGDYLFAQSAARCVATGDLRVIGLFAETLGAMCQGQLDEAARPADVHLSLTREAYYQTIWNKTASLFVLACQGGAILGRLPEEVVQALRQYGEGLGLAFQLVDDILDFVGDEGLLGKPVGHDLRQGTITLPVIYLREELGNGAFAEAFAARDLDWIVGLVQRSAAIERCYQEARALAAQAREQLRVAPPGPVRDSLEELTHFVVARLA